MADFSLANFDMIALLEQFNSVEKLSLFIIGCILVISIAVFACHKFTS